MNLTLKIWRQKNAEDKGKLEEYKVSDISEHMSFLEMMDVLNEQLTNEGKEPVAFDHDCREGICGSCSMFINGRPHGPGKEVTTCQLHMRSFKDGDTIYIEPWRAKAFPVMKDLVVDRSAFDRIIQAGGYVSVNTTGNSQDANAIPIERKMRIKLLMQPPVLVVELALQLVKMPQLPCLYLLKSANWLCYHKVRLKPKTEQKIWSLKWTKKVLVAAPILEHVKRNVLKEFP